MVTQHQVWDLSSYITASTHLFCFRCVPGVHNSGALMGTAPSCLSLSIFKSISDYKCNENKVSGQFSSVQLLICIQLFATTCIVAHQASLSITNCQSLPKLMSIESVMPSNHLIPFSSCLHSFPASGSFPMSQFFTSGGQSIGVSALASVFPKNTQDCFPLGLTGWTSLQPKGLSRVFSNITVQKHQFFSTQPSL